MGLQSTSVPLESPVAQRGLQPLGFSQHQPSLLPAVATLVHLGVLAGPEPPHWLPPTPVGFHCCRQLLSCILLFVTPWTPAHQASLPFTIFQSLLKLMSVELKMLSNHWPLRECYFLTVAFPDLSDGNRALSHTMVTVILGSLISYLYIRHTAPRHASYWSRTP